MLELAMTSRRHDQVPTVIPEHAHDLLDLQPPYSTATMISPPNDLSSAARPQADVRCKPMFGPDDPVRAVATAKV
jgi:hypothetical protein